MMEGFLALLPALGGALQPGGEADQAGAESVRLLFQVVPPAWVLGLVVAPAILALVFLAYARPRRSPGARRVLQGLRTALLALAVLLALGPFLRRSREHTEPAPLALLYDDSASLQRRDPLPPQARERLQQAGLVVAAEPRRADLVQALASSAWRGTLEARYRLEAWRFAERLSPTAADGSGLEARGGATALGDALLALLGEHRGRRLPDVVLLSDGRSNRGTDSLAAADRLRTEGVRVHVVALGDPRPAPDLALERVQAPEVVLRGDEALFLLRLRGSGSGLPRQATVRLLDDRGRTLDQAAVAPAEAGAQFALGARLEAPGIQRLAAVVEDLPEETARDNNRLELAVEVKDVKIRILYVDGTGRWEYRYLKNRLVRATGDFVARCWLADASPDFPQEASPGVERLRRVPTSAEELLENFDVVILGDADPAALDPDPRAGPRLLDALNAFVRRGGGLLLLAGPRHNPRALRGTALEPLLPVVPGEGAGPLAVPFRPTPPDPSLPHPVTLLEQGPEASARIWRSLTPLWWYSPAERLRPGAQAWLVHPEVQTAEGPMVLAAGIPVPEGTVGWLGTDETWRWRDPDGERYLNRFWRALLRHLAAGRLRGAEGRARLDLDRSRVELGQSVTAEARLRDESYQPLLREEGVDAFLENRPNPVHLAPVPDQLGTYRGRFRPGEPGPGLLVLTADGRPESPPLATARFEVVLPSAEMRNTAQDAATLEALAARTGGTLVPAEGAFDLLQRLDGRERAVRTLGSQDSPLDGSFLLALFLLLGCGEWLLRKWINLS